MSVTVAPDVDLELDVLTALVRDPQRGARLIFRLSPADFATLTTRRLFYAIRALEHPVARHVIDTSVTPPTVRWHVEGLAEALRARSSTPLDPTPALKVLADALDRAPLLPFGDGAVERLNELTRRRARARAWADCSLDGLTIADLEALDRRLADYVAASLEEDVTDLEASIERALR